MDLLPRPRVVKTGHTTHRLGRPGQALALGCENKETARSALAQEGLRVLRAALVAQGAAEPRIGDPPADAAVVLERCPFQALAVSLKAAGLEDAPDSPRAREAYLLTVEAGPDGARVRLRAAGDLGIYYGCLTLGQMLRQDADGAMVVPEIEVADWPEVGHRLVKQNALKDTAALRQATACFALLRFDLTALHLVSPPAKDPPALFFDNVRQLGADCRERGTPEMVVYFCPFAASKVVLNEKQRDWTGVFDFTKPEDRRQYVELVGRIMDLGARGVQVDYNDWPDRGDGAPVEDVLNLAYKAVRDKDPSAYVLFCPSVYGKLLYFGPASAEMRRALANAPKDLWTLWTGPSVRMTPKPGRHNYRGPLAPGDIENWTKQAGRKPFFWLNRVTAQDREKMEFAVPCPGDPTRFVFRGEWLPENLGDLVEGVHFNHSFCGKEPDERDWVYLATAADWLWNPRAWDAADACRRAQRYVERMRQLARAFPAAKQ